MKEGWVKKKLGEVCTLHKEQGIYSNLPYIGMEHIESSSGILLSWINASDVKSMTFKFDKGDVLYGRLRPYLKKVIIAPFEGCCSTEIFPIKSKAVLADFLKYWFLLDSTTEKINDTCSGCRMPRANMNRVINFDFKYPSKPEQHRIVEKLDAGFAKIEQIKANAEKNLQQAKDLLEKIIKRQLYFTPNYKETKMGDICNLYQGLAINSKTKHLLVEHSSLPLLRIKDLKEKTCSMFVKEEGYPPSCLAHENDIIYTRTGTLGYVFTGRYGIMHNNCFKIKINEHEILKKYFMYYINNDTFRNHITKLAQRAAQPDITHKLFKDQDIAYPVSLTEQQRIVDKLDKLSDICKKLEDNYNRILTECDALKQALLRKAFNGEL